jgi:KUP system potassium uptake protein
MQGGEWGISIMKLAFQSVGVVYGDLGTSPLYVLPGVFPNGIKHNDDILGVLSLIFYSLMSITLIKYVFIVLAANDNGDGNLLDLNSLMLVQSLSLYMLMAILRK